MTEAALSTESTTTTTAAAAVELVIERVFDAPVEKVFAAWTEPDQIVRWWGPEGMTVPESEFDFRVGGKWRTTMASPDSGTHTCSGEYREIDSPNRVAFTWAWEEDGKRGHETLVTVTLKAQGDKTLMHFEHRTFESTEIRDKHEHGWSSSFHCLRDALA